MRNELNKLIEDELFREFKELKELKQKISEDKPNIFTILKNSFYEIRHSNFLAWLLDPNQTHGMGSKFLELFIEKVNANNSQNIHMNFNSLAVSREKHHIDLIIDSDEAMIAIENKFGGGESEGQLRSYRRKLDEIYSPKKIHRIFLTISGYETTSDCRVLDTNFT